MKASLIEYDGCFGIDLTGETVEEANAIVRFGINATKELRYAAANAFRDKTIMASIVIGKRSWSGSTIGRKK